jgi:hypothetical protein
MQAKDGNLTFKLSSKANAKPVFVLAGNSNENMRCLVLTGRCIKSKGALLLFII